MTFGPLPASIRGTYLFGKETSFGTGGTATKDIGLMQTFSVAPDALIESQMGQGQAAAVGVKNGKVTPKGSFELIYQHGRPIEWMIYGGVTTHVASSADNTHTHVWAEQLPSFAWEGSYELGATDNVQKGVGLIFGTTTINSALDGFLKISGDWMAGTVDNSATSATAAVVNTGNALGGFENSLSIGGTAVNYVQSWSLTMNPNTKLAWGEGSRVPAFGSSHGRQVTFKAKVGFENTTQINRTLGTGGTISTTEPSGFAMTFAADNGIALGSGKRALTIGLTGCQFKYNVTAAKNDFVFYDIDGEGLLGAATSVDQLTSGTW